MTLSEQIALTLGSKPHKPFIDFRGRWYTRGEAKAVGDRIQAILDQAGVARDVPVAMVVRNRAPHAAAIICLFAQSRSFSMIYAYQSPDSIARDIATLNSVAVIADKEDWTPEAIAAARAAGSIGIALSVDEPMVSLVPGLESLGPGPHRAAPAEAGIEVLSSGTTGAPKRILIRMPVLIHAVTSVKLGLPPSDDMPPDITAWPFGGIGGICGLAAAGYLGRGVTVLEKFNIPDFLNAVKQNKVKLLSATPAMIRMILDAKVPKEAFAGVQAVYGGSAALDPETQEEFEAAYGIPILWAYGATEFAGTAVAWTPALREKFGGLKRGSIGRALVGATVRIVDPETGSEAPRGQQGHLEARINALGPGWIRTTDIGSMDADDFVWLHGRGDGAINRGGFKVIPDTVAACLRRHPAVLDAAVIGVDDRRLGQVPVAAVELKSGVAGVTEDDLKEHVRQNLTAYQVPVRVHVMKELPRTPSMKVALSVLRQQLTA
jgi:acyl-coenzyme A synthetase/AMP-(fatty) acid ligase